MMSYSFSPVATIATVKPLKSDVMFSHLTNPRKAGYLKPLKTVGIKICTTAFLVSLLATCQPSYAEVELSRFGINSDFVEELNKINAIASHYQPLNNDSFILVDMAAVSGNNDRQELQNLFVTVQHHTIVDVFLCLPFISLPVMGELRLAIAFIALWWGGRGNKPFTRRILCAVVTAVLNLPAALYLGQITKTSLPFRKVV
jgi:hypothetical protein